MELELLLLGLEPLVAVTVGAGAIVVGGGALALSPAFGEVLGKPELAQELQESGRSMVKTGLVLSLDAYDKVQTAWTETSTTVGQLLEEAKTEAKQVRMQEEVQAAS
ncbi:hypothetical protein GlitD10_1391 [Gloeomargarita lithophora Alchichica-D10]|uniref:DUF5132 domain-containing protein n=2 Tax=Gloeomargarita TaxID=1188227 RepID=A0A1J0ACS1_9CYAN|nr:hypothetical protein GlitD10_1391 [Gloeomargarita lithophora Alchichica-D10]